MTFSYIKDKDGDGIDQWLIIAKFPDGRKTIKSFVYSESAAKKAVEELNKQEE